MPGVYISYPFCGQKCTYCNFASGVFPRPLERRYMQALRSEVIAHHWPWTPGTLYLGGGTPSLMADDGLERLLEAVPGRPWAEATIEAAPGTITARRALLWQRVGIDRVSLGVQSFVPREIRRTGRRHTAETVAGEIALLGDAGIGRVNIDLIAGLPGQTVETWSESLGWIERLNPGHVSVYMLEVDQDSRLGREILRHGPRYAARETPSEDVVAALYETAVERLDRMGLARYEISNFARPGEESRHNLKYWRLQPYAGFGADAHSFDGEARRRNAESVTDYVAAMENSGSAFVESVPANLDEERFFVGLRLREGIRPRVEDWQRLDSVIRRFVQEGLLEAGGGVLRLTARGVLLSNEVFQEFLCP